MSILITGFGSFPGVDENPAESLLNAWNKPDNVSIEILPVEYDFCNAWADKLESDYEFMVHFGVAVNRTVNSLESKALKRCGSSPDISGRFHSYEVSGKDEYKCSLDLESLCESLVNTGFNVEISDDAGDYLCNFIYYKTLSSEKKSLFVHIPPFKEIGLENQLQFLNALIREISSQLHSQSH